LSQSSFGLGGKGSSLERPRVHQKTLTQLDAGTAY